ncbi:transporter [bacterium]|nr:transporter [bacterium]
MKRIITLLSIIVCLNSFAQETIDAQRPTLTESNTVVAPGIIQAETGFTYIDQFYGLNTFVRFGITERLEFRFATAYASPNLDLSGKVFIWEGKGAIPGLSFQLDYNPFFGRQNYTLSATGSLSEKFFYTVNAGNDYNWYALGLIGFSYSKGCVFAEYKYHETYQQIHGGVTYILKNEVQIDINGGLIDYTTPYVGAGLAFRLKPFDMLKKAETPTTPVAE